MTGRKLGILSDARYRFERGVDPASTLPGLEAATKMILDLCGGEASEVVIAGKAPEVTKSLAFSPSQIKSRAGIEVSQEQARAILTKLGFHIKVEGQHLTVLIPSWRFDVEQDVDLVEEVLRIEGYDKISSTPYEGRPVQKPLTTLQARRFVARDRLAGRGLMEVVTWSFISQEEAKPFGGIPESLILLNPISQDLDAMRLVFCLIF